MKKLTVLLAILAASSLLSACNTIAGVGKDVQKVGQAVEGAGRR
jgi:predicted small secreted protein